MGLDASCRTLTRSPTQIVSRHLIMTPCSFRGLTRLVANWRTLTNGGGGIRTHGRLAPTTVFKTVPIGHSGTPPGSRSLTALVDDVLGDVDRDVDRHGHRDGVAGAGVDFDELAAVADPELGVVRV